MAPAGERPIACLGRIHRTAGPAAGAGAGKHLEDRPRGLPPQFADRCVHSPNSTGPASRWQEDVPGLYARVAEGEAGEVERTVEVIELAREGRQRLLIERGCGVDARDDEPAVR